MLHVVTGNAKNMIMQKQHINYQEIAQKVACVTFITVAT